MQDVMQEVELFVRNHMYLSLAWIGLFGAIVFMTIKMKLSKVKDLGHVAATNLINREEAVIVDIRTRDEFRKGHITKAINLTASDIKNGNLGELEKRKTHPVIVVCADGNAARASAEALYKQGFSQVNVLKDGIVGWNGANLPLVSHKGK